MEKEWSLPQSSLEVGRSLRRAKAWRSNFAATRRISSSGDCLDLLLAALIVIEAEANQFIDRNARRKGRVALVTDCFGADKLLFLREPARLP